MAVGEEGTYLTSLAFDSYSVNTGGGYKASFVFEGFDGDMTGCFTANSTWPVSASSMTGPKCVVLDGNSAVVAGLTGKTITSDTISPSQYQGTLDIYPLSAGAYTLEYYDDTSTLIGSESFVVANTNPKMKDLASGVLVNSISASATSLVVNVGSGTDAEIKSVWPDTPFYITVMPANPSAGVPNSLDSEIMKVSAVGTDGSGNTTLSVARAQRGSTAQAFTEEAIITNASYAEDGVFVGEGGSSETPSPWVENGMIKDKAITSNKVYEGTLADGALVEVIGTTTGNSANYAWKFADGRLINFQHYTISGNATTSWGSVYSGIFCEPRDYAVAFTAKPIVSAQLDWSASTGNCWLAQANEKGSATASHPGGYQLVRPTSMSGLTTEMSLVAYGFWK